MKIAGCTITFRTINELKVHLLFELKIILAEWKLILIGLLCQYIHSIFHNLAYWMQMKLTPEQRMPLYDQGFELLPELTDAQANISEYLVFGGIFGPSIVLFVSILFIKPSGKSPPRLLSLLAKRVLLQTGMCLMLRCVSFLVTSLPGAAPHCRPTFNATCLDVNAANPGKLALCMTPNPYFKPPTTAVDMFFHIDALNGCGDLMFSSHTTYTMSFILAVFKYWRNKYVLVAMLLLQIAIAFVIVAARKHYTLDVIVALYVVPMVWFIQEAYHCDLNHKDAEVTPAAIKAAYGFDAPDDSVPTTGQVLMQTSFHETETPTTMVAP
ncbi:Aste57867_21449 [Aphanomyces stellatus]|uniref:Aste57867_21449 protein n=1 Tax=Aphanomyces stellatus TaxID=120398 RepID=A0A485LIU2_9STRA|nr:hypothetical protein As57867_021380 [Aphanomyces stellatus]VFT98120.1 Aste57867_21449 [Aphanomyces stellatus]